MSNNIRIVKIAGTPPARATEHAAASDLLSQENYLLAKGERHLFKTGIRIALPTNCCALILPRSGLALKHGITVANSPGLIDADYRGEIGVVLINHGDESYMVNYGDRIAQIMVTPFIEPEWIEAEELDETARGTGGFGSTGHSAEVKA